MKRLKNVVSTFLTATALGLLVTGTGMAAGPVNWSKVVDHGSQGYLESGGPWRTYISPQANYGSYRYLSHWHRGVPRKGTATWLTEIPYSGTYRVSVSFRRTENRSPDADYAVMVGGKIIRWFSVDQHGDLALIWKDLGVYEYKKGQIAGVFLDGRDDNWSDCADATKWELVELADPPVNAGANHLLLGR